MDRQTLTCCGEEMELENLRSLESYGYAEEAVIHLGASPLPDDSRFSILVKSANHPYATISVMEKETNTRMDNGGSMDINFAIPCPNYPKAFTMTELSSSPSKIFIAY
uniref:Ubiquitin-like domain-containing protein n=1 Tax=Salix viminalis TaxID=40686 RepID=A0A6N2KLK8_SALVM